MLSLNDQIVQLARPTSLTQLVRIGVPSDLTGDELTNLLKSSRAQWPQLRFSVRESAALSYEPHQRWRQMGQLHNVMQKPQEALADFDRANQLAVARNIASALADPFFAQTANGRAHASPTC